MFNNQYIDFKSQLSSKPLFEVPIGVMSYAIKKGTASINRSQNEADANSTEKQRAGNWQLTVLSPCSTGSVTPEPSHRRYTSGKRPHRAQLQTIHEFQKTGNHLSSESQSKVREFAITVNVKHRPI